MVAPVRATPRGKVGAPIGIGDIVSWYTGLEVPDPITFTVGESWLNRPNLYPRQGTLLKIIFLRDDLFTAYDYEVIEEWTSSFRNTGYNGIQPDLLQRIAILREQGRKWFKEVLLVMGRRAGKGHLSAMAQAYVLWNYMAKGDPQNHYGVDRSKRLTCLIFAGKREQAKANLWKDLVNVITEGPCFTKYISKFQAESLTIFAPQDFVRMKKMAERGVDSVMDPATFEILPKESTLMAGRGPASFMQGYDEMAHVVASGANRSAEDVYCLDPGTRVLKADFTWVTIDSLVPGDTLVALDEEPPGTAGSPRKLREAAVVHKWDTEGTSYRITLEDGSSVVCSGNHRWLRSRGPGGNARWASITAPPVLRGGAGGNWAQLRVGDSIKHLVDPWGTDQSREGGYLSGIYDGEGHIRFDERGSMKVGFAQNPGPVRDYVIGLLEAAGFDLKHDSKSTKCQSFQITSLADCFRFLGTYQPLRLMQNARNLWQGRAVRGNDGSKRVVSIEELPAQRLVDIETTTGTFIAEGLVSHNSAATPSLDQFGKDGFIIEPSSPWQMMGQFYENYQQSLAFDEQGKPVYPDKMMVQLTSWDIYVDWEIAHEIPMFPPCYDPETFTHAEDCEHSVDGGRIYDYGDFVPTSYFQELKGAIQTYDDDMVRLKMSNPETFAVERESKFATAIDAYLNADKVTAMFREWNGRLLTMQDKGNLIYTYKAHSDPSKSNANFATAIAHPEYDDEGNVHCVFDFIHHFDPADFPDHTIDYDEVEQFIWGKIKAFVPEVWTFDQWNSASMIQRLQKKVREQNFPKNVQVYEETATAAHNWKRAENFKTALNMGWVHAPYYEQAELELKFLQEKNGKVEKPSMGPIQTKDVADCIMECVHFIVGEQVNAFMAGDLSAFRPGGAMAGGITPFPGMSQQDNSDPMALLASFSRSRGGGRESGYGMAPGRRQALRPRRQHRA